MPGGQGRKGVVSSPRWACLDMKGVVGFPKWACLEGGRDRKGVGLRYGGTREWEHHVGRSGGEGHHHMWSIAGETRSLTTSVGGA